MKPLYYGLGGILLGIIVGTGAFNFASFKQTPVESATQKILEKKVEDDFLILGRTNFYFSRLEKTGENQYIGEINGKNYGCFFDLENKRIEFYFGVKK